MELDKETHRYTGNNFSRDLLAAIVDRSHRSNEIHVWNLNSEDKLKLDDFIVLDRFYCFPFLFLTEF